MLAPKRALARRIDELTATVKDPAALFEIVVQDIENLDSKFSREIAPLRKPRIGFHMAEKPSPSQGSAASARWPRHQ